MNLYEGPQKCSCCINWVEDYPNDLKEYIEDTEETKKHALLVRNKKGHGTARPMVIHSIQIQSPILRSILRDVFCDYPGIVAELEILTFESPFRAFFYRLEELRSTTEKQTDQDTVDHLELLYKVISADMIDTLQVHQDLVTHNVITYDYLWTLFPPGELVYTKVQNQDRVFRVKNEVTNRVTQHGDYWELSCNYVNWDGEKFVWNNHRLRVERFPGTLAITDLEVYPLKYHRQEGELKEKLKQRGEKFVSLAGYYHVGYNGLAVHVGEMASIFSIFEEVNIKGRIVVDEQTFSQFNPQGESSLEPLADREEPMTLTFEELLLCTPVPRGYSLDTKKWAQFFVDYIQDIAWNENAFPSLVLPGSYKEVIISLVEDQLQQNDIFDDVMKGKGKGVIFLLAGPPGVGKTLTAESIAEHIKVPLYSLSASELGSDAQDAEYTIEKVFSIVTKWKAILLLDEADVFLEKRTRPSIVRNRVISVLLRMLEYYQGIMFMTTNRIQAIDSAFESRIHITINYPDLDASTRKAIWSNFLGILKQPARISDPEIACLAENVMNGRQIKNALKIATLLASRSGNLLAMEHIQMALQIETRNGPILHHTRDKGSRLGVLEFASTGEAENVLFGD
ncbi:P-loop containing nucleoside triphosphate hydrolase protein [Xylaria scruposa]|nr:P-loop containing nucleoside triphosphate hydrolase protein [Xylaria scruposa]